MDILPGTARKVALLLLIVSLVGWVVFMISFIILAQDLSRNQLTIVDVFWFPHWLFLIGGMVGFIILFGSVCMGNKIFNFLDTICVAIFLLVCGSLVYFNTLVVTRCTQSSDLISCSVGLTRASLPLKLQAASCGFIALSLVIYLLLQYCFVWSIHSYNRVAIQQNTAYGRLGADPQSAPTSASNPISSTPYPPSSIDAATENTCTSHESLHGYE